MHLCVFVLGFVDVHNKEWQSNMELMSTTVGWFHNMKNYL